MLILILEHATIYHASSSMPTLDQALNCACSQYRASNTHNAVIKQFSAAPQTYSLLQFTEFILGHHLGWICSLAVIYSLLQSVTRPIKNILQSIHLSHLSITCLTHMLLNCTNMFPLSCSCMTNTLLDCITVPWSLIPLLSSLVLLCCSRCFPCCWYLAPS